MELSLIIQREYFERVRRKSFIITTILMPVIMIAMMAFPAVISILSGPEKKTIAVVDPSGIVGNALPAHGELSFAPVEMSVEEAKSDNNYDGVLVIGENLVSDDTDVSLYTREAVSLATEESISSELSRIVEQKRLQRYDIENLDQIIAAVQSHVRMQTFTLGDDGEKETSSAISYMIGIVMMMILYMFILMYGQMVMTSIIEEKANRVLEVVVSSVKPYTLLMGKLLGIGCVALTQILIWAFIILAFTMWGLPAILSSASDMDSATLSLVLGIGNPAYIMKLFGCMTLFLVGGYLFYSSIYAAIGSSVDNIQDASQLTSFATMPIIIGLLLAFTIVNDPTSQLAFWTSMIPFTSPMVMMSRMPFGVAGWEIALSAVLLFVSVLFMIWLSAKIYRIGIFMYGKKPNIKDLVRWAKYK